MPCNSFVLLVVGCFTPLKEVPFQFPNQNMILIFQSKEGSFKMYSMLCPSYIPPNSLQLKPQFFQKYPKKCETFRSSEPVLLSHLPEITVKNRSSAVQTVGSCAVAVGSTKPQVKPDGWRDGEERCVMEEPLVAQETHQNFMFFCWHIEKVIAST